MTSLEAATLATTDATFSGTSLASLPLLSPAVPSEPAEAALLAGWQRRLGSLHAASLATGLPAHLPSCPGHRAAAEMPSLGGSQSCLVRDGISGSSRFGLPPGAPFLPQGWLGDGERWRLGHLGAGLVVSAQRPEGAPRKSHWSLSTWGLA